MNKIYKKIFVGITLLLVLTLVACAKSDPIVYITDVVATKVKVDFNINVVDINNKIQGTTVNLYLYDEEDLEVKKLALDLTEVGGNVSARSFTGLTEGTDYTFVLKATINDEVVTLSDEIKFTTLQTVRKEIYTTQDFLSINTLTSSIDEFVLKNDLDFTGIAFDTSSRITTFNKVFEGNGHTISNVHSSRSLFGTISSGGKVRNLKIENMVIAGDKQEDGSYDALKYESTSTQKNYGFIADNVTTGSSLAISTVENIEINNSLIKVDLSFVDGQTVNVVNSGENQTVRFGAVTGSFQGSATNISVTNTTIDVNSLNSRSVQIGGIFGFVGTTSTSSTSTVNYITIKEVVSEVEIKFNQVVDEDKLAKYTVSTSATKFNRDIRIGLIAGYVRVNNVVHNEIIKDAVGKGSIDVNVSFSVKHYNLGENQEKRHIDYFNNVYVGGLIGLIENAFVNNMVFQGTININHNDTLLVNFNQELEDYHAIYEAFKVGALFGEITGRKINKGLVNNGSIINIKTLEENTTLFNASSFIGKAGRNDLAGSHLENPMALYINDNLVVEDLNYAQVEIEELDSSFIKAYLNK